MNIFIFCNGWFFEIWLDGRYARITVEDTRKVLIARGNRHRSDTRKQPRLSISDPGIAVLPLDGRILQSSRGGRRRIEQNRRVRFPAVMHGDRCNVCVTTGPIIERRIFDYSSRKHSRRKRRLYLHGIGIPSRNRIINADLRFIFDSFVTKTETFNEGQFVGWSLSNVHRHRSNITKTVLQRMSGWLAPFSNDLKRNSFPTFQRRSNKVSITLPSWILDKNRTDVILSIGWRWGWTEQEHCNANILGSGEVGRMES